MTDLTFEPRKQGAVDIDIMFMDGDHGDGRSNAFDGNGGTLAHAFYPAYGGDVHFDNGETWTMASNIGQNLRQTAAHEFGHSLGLEHSDHRKALMYPFSRGYERQINLDIDDVTAITSLYGKKKPKLYGSSNNGVGKGHINADFVTQCFAYKLKIITIYI